jgi:hypothetical protein
MQYAAEVVEPLTEVRDVVETFRQSGVKVPAWHDALAAAVDALNGLPYAELAGVELAQLTGCIHVLIHQGLDDEPQITAQVADWVATALVDAKVPGIPRPDEDDWGFSASIVA